MYNVPIARKVCATCEWWRASRELEFAGAREPRYVVVDNISLASFGLCPELHFT